MVPSRESKRTVLRVKPLASLQPYSSTNQLNNSVTRGFVDVATRHLHLYSSATVPLSAYLNIPLALLSKETALPCKTEIEGLHLFSPEKLPR